MQKRRSEYPSLVALADRIDTGLDNPDTSRALIVFSHFNHSDGPISGTAVFFAAMSWTAAMPLPAITVSELDGPLVPSAITAYAESPDKKGRPDRCWLNFELRFAVQEIPPQGWKTYIASYLENSPPALMELPGKHGLIVIETTRHGGDLPPVGTCLSSVGPTRK